MDKTKLENLVKFGGAAALLGIGGFAALFLIKSIVALAVVTVGGLVLWNGLPVFAQWCAQMKLKGHKMLAAKNPVEDLQLLYLKKQESLVKAGEAVTNFSAITRGYKGKLDDFAKKRPEKVAEFKPTYDKMQRVLTLQNAKLEAARNQLTAFSGVIDEANDMWIMAQEMMKANAAMNAFDGKDPLDAIREKTALDSVTFNLNKAMAELDTALLLDGNAAEDKIAELEFQTSETIEVPVTVKETVNVPRTR